MTKNSLINVLVALLMCMAFLALPVANVQATSASVTGISPNSGKQGASISATITGTGFTGASRVRIKDGNGNAIIDYGSGSFTVDSDTQIRLSFIIPADAVPGPGYVRVYTTSGSVYLYDGFTVLGPYIDSFDPVNAKQGQTLSVVLTGGGFTGATAVSFSGTGITVTGFNVDSDTQITAAVTVAADATLGDRDISVTTPDGTGTKSGDFTIFAASSPGWVIETVDTGTENGFEYPSIAMDSSNRPHISYYDSDNADLKYASYNGTAWVKETVDSAGSVGMFSSLKMDGSGNPRIAYYDATNYALKFARWTGSAWQVMTVDSAGSADGVGFDGISLALDGAGCPHIAYYDKNNLTLKYAGNTSDPFNPASWVTSTVPDVSGGLGCSLALDSGGDAHISYHRNWDAVYYVYQSGGAWQAPLQVSEGRGYYPSLALDSGGSPHISYGPNDGIIKYAYNPPAWTIRDVQSTNMGSAHTSLALDSSVNQYAHIFYYYQNTYFLGYASDNGAAFPYQVVEGGIFPYVGSLALDSNNIPHVAYQGASCTLKHAYYSGASEPTVTAVNPSIGTQGQTIATVIVTGTNLTGASAVSFGTGITVNSFTVNSATQVTASVTIAAGAATGTRNVSITTGGGTGTGNNLFTVTAPAPTPAPTISSVSPNSGTWGQTLAVTITGANFTGATSVNFGPDITVTFTVVSPTQINATITIAVGATIGARTISVATPQGTGTNSFTVNLNPSLTNGPQSHGGGGGSGSSGGGSGNGNQGISPVSMPNIVVQSATISNTRVAPGETVTITANLTNKGTTNGTSAVKVYVNGQEAAVQGVTVNSGSNRPVSFTLSRNEPGTYTVYVGGTQAGSFTVEQAADPNILLLISIALVIAGLVLGAIYIRRRQNYY